MQFLACKKTPASCDYQGLLVFPNCVGAVLQWAGNNNNPMGVVCVGPAGYKGNAFIVGGGNPLSVALAGFYGFALFFNNGF